MLMATQLCCGYGSTGVLNSNLGGKMSELQ